MIKKMKQGSEETVINQIELIDKELLIIQTYIFFIKERIKRLKTKKKNLHRKL